MRPWPSRPGLAEAKELVRCTGCTWPGWRGAGLTLEPQRTAGVPGRGPRAWCWPRPHTLRATVRPACDAHLHHHEGLAVPAERVLKEVGELGVAKGHVAVAGAQSRDDVPQGRQRLVDVLRLPQAAALGPRLAHALRAGQVHQVQLPCGEGAGQVKAAPEGADAGGWCSGRAACRPRSPVVRRPVLQSTPRTVTMSRAWERELCSFRLVNSVVRLVWPNSNTWTGGAAEARGLERGLGAAPSPSTPVRGCHPLHCAEEGSEAQTGPASARVAFSRQLSACGRVPHPPGPQPRTLLMSSTLCTWNSVSPGTYSCPLPSGHSRISSFSWGSCPSRSLEPQVEYGHPLPPLPQLVLHLPRPLTPSWTCRLSTPCPPPVPPLHSVC